MKNYDDLAPMAFMQQAADCTTAACISEVVRCKMCIEDGHMNVLASLTMVRAWSSCCSCAANKASPAVDSCPVCCADGAAGTEADGVALLLIPLPAAAWSTAILSTSISASHWQQATLRFDRTRQRARCLLAHQQVSRDFITWRRRCR